MSGFLPYAKPVLLLTLNTCVSTAIVGKPKPSFKTTLAVFFPTPGKAYKSSKFFGTLPLCFSINCFDNK